MPGRTVAALVTVALLANAAARPLAAQDSTVIRALIRHAVPFTLDNGTLHGAGADALLEIARSHQFILVGEDHGFQEVPAFVGALYELARPAGYAHLAVEIGPITGRWLDSTMHAPDGIKGLESWLHRYTPFTLPFFFWREEAAMVQRVVRADPRARHVIWGLDQEFILSPTYHFQALARLAPTSAAKALADRAAASSAEADRRFISEGNPQAQWMSATSDSEVQAFAAGYRARPGTLADTIVRELVESREIYRKIFAGRNYESNSQRDEMMRRHFMTEYVAAQRRGERAPKVILKFGANHIFRGPSLSDTYELGSFVPELALAGGTRAYNIIVLVARGTSNAYRPFSKDTADKRKPYDPRSSDNELSFTNVDTFLAAAKDSSWTFLDLRPVRQLAHDRKLGAVDSKVMRALLAFDGMIIVPEGHASTYFF
jgi:hypothetical protein